MEDALLGTTLGQYELVEMIGRGGMATVYKAHQAALRRFVAVKVLPAFFANDPDFTERFRREAFAVAQLEHPNILPIYDFGTERGIAYIVMPLVAGGTLADRVGTPNSLAWSITICEQVARALDHAHARSVVHRDVKPANVLLAHEDWALLSDFGIAHIVNATAALTRTGMGIGTPQYLSPEQGQGLPVDGRSDVYSLGMMFFEMVTGRVPYDADTPIAVIYKQVNDPVPSLREAWPDTSPELDDAVRRALAKQPDNRFATGGEFAAALRAAVGPRTTGAPAITPPRVAQPPVPAPPARSPKRRAVAAAIVGGLLAVAAAIAWPLANAQRPAIEQSLTPTVVTATPDTLVVVPTEPTASAVPLAESEDEEVLAAAPPATAEPASTATPFVVTATPDPRATSTPTPPPVVTVTPEPTLRPVLTRLPPPPPTDLPVIRPPDPTPREVVLPTRGVEPLPRETILPPRLSVQITDADCTRVTGRVVSPTGPVRDYTIKASLFREGVGVRPLGEDVTVTGPDFRLAYPTRPAPGTWELRLTAGKQGFGISPTATAQLSC